MGSYPAYARLGLAYVEKHRETGKLRYYDRALGLLPGHVPATEHLAELHAARGEWEEAEGLFHELLKTRPGPQYRLGLAEACRQQGKTREARRESAKALRQLRQSAGRGVQDAIRPLALLLLEREETAAEGLRWAERDWEVRQDALTADTQAWAHHCSGHAPEALRWSEQALESGSKTPALLLHSGLIHCRCGQEEEGRALLRDSLGCQLAFGPHERTLAESARKLLTGGRTPAAGP